MLPVDPLILIPFALAVAVVELTPGPNMGWLALLSAQHGRAAGGAAVAGITLGLSVYMFAAALGIAELVIHARPVYEALRWIGILYLLWLAWVTWSGQDRTQTNTQSDGSAKQLLRRAFARGLILNLLNPKAAVFYIAVLPTFIVPGRAPPLTQALLLGATHLFISVVVHGVIVLAAASATRYMDTRAIVVRRAFGISIAAIALWLTFSTRWPY